MKLSLTATLLFLGIVLGAYGAVYHFIGGALVVYTFGRLYEQYQLGVYHADAVLLWGVFFSLLGVCLHLYDTILKCRKEDDICPDCDGSGKIPEDVGKSEVTSSENIKADDAPLENPSSTPSEKEKRDYSKEFSEYKKRTGKTFYDFFKMKVEESGTTMEELHRRLLVVFPDETKQKPSVADENKKNSPNICPWADESIFCKECIERGDYHLYLCEKLKKNGC